MNTTPKDIERLAVSIREACELTGVKKDLIYREINAGRLRSAKVKGRRLILKASLQQWLTNAEHATGAAMGFGLPGTEEE